MKLAFLSLFFIAIFTLIFNTCESNKSNTSKDDKQKQVIYTTDNPSFNPKTGVFIADEYTAGLWHMDEGKDRIIFDESKNDNSGLLTDADWTKGKFGTGVKFDGKRSYIEIEEMKNPQSLSPKHAITIEFWSFFDPKQMNIVSLVVKDTILESSGRPSYEVFLNNYKEDEYGFNICFRISTDAGEFTMPAGISWEKYIGAWHYFAATYDGKEMKLYIDGKLIVSRKRTGKLIQNNNPLRLSRKYSHGNLLNGIMDEVRISNVARSEIAIKTYWNSVKKIK
ncbi:MAG: LamG domain-containing protein [Spirochaetota bacterium]|nr:LamG domain-containing protein [Spirochaetota bacterium]